MLFGTSEGIKKVGDETLFDEVEAVFELDKSFECFSEESRYFTKCPVNIYKNECEQLSKKYGFNLMRSIWSLEGVVEPALETYSERDKLGYKDGQLLIGFNHNTPDNTLPIFWYDENDINWFPIFKRYNKKYGY